MLAIYKPGESEDIPSVFAWYILPGELGSHPVLTPHRIKRRVLSGRYGHESPLAIFPYIPTVMRASLLGAPLHRRQCHCATVLVQIVSSTKYPGPDRTLLCAVRVNAFSSAPISIVQCNIKEVVILEIPRHGASGTPDLTARERWGGRGEQIRKRSAGRTQRATHISFMCR